MNVWIAWKEVGPYQVEYKAPIIHEQGDNGKTVCGISFGIDWAFECHDNRDAIDCKRCLRRIEKKKRS